MKTRRLGRDGPLVSAIGLGCMRMSNIMGGSQPERDSDSEREGLATIEAALDAGITLVNTGDFYGMGHNEALVARAIRRRRDWAFISVKCGIQRTHTGAILGMDGRPNSIKNYAAYSLQRLGVDYIDLYQPARADPSVPYEETIGAVADLISEGKVRYLGVSEVNAGNLSRAHGTHPVAALEIEYSLASRFIEREMLPLARELGIAVVAYGVVSQGLLTGTMRGGVVKRPACRLLLEAPGRELTDEPRSG
ncbi:aldo/keto reductase [Mesorhizobium sp. M0019]|uniref:aldo/keto reductase n=1 Tax=Mesorhizobium sp. M0019 TaxID=2956845 RepID=UPI00333C1E1A